MGTETSACPACGAAIEPQDKFCGACGRVLDGTAGMVTKKGTMLGISAEALRRQMETEAARQGQSVAEGRKRTVLGLSPADVPVPDAGEREPSDPALQNTVLSVRSPAPAAEPSPAGEPAQRTVFGMRAEGAGPDRSGGDPPAPEARKGALNKTLLGVAAPLPPAAGSPPAAAPEPSGSLGKGRTILGMRSPLTGGTPSEATPDLDSAEPAREAPPPGDLDPQTQRTMLGMAAHPGQPAKASAKSTASSGTLSSGGRDGARSGPGDRTTTDELVAAIGVDRGRRKSGSSGARWLSAVLGALAAAAVLGGVAFWLLTGRPPELEVAVVAGERGDVLSVRLPQAAPGTRVRHAGLEQEVKAGLVRFPLGAEALEVGDNTVALDVVEPSGSVHTTEVSLHVSYRARLDLGGLAASPPAVVVVIDALPGSQVEVDGKPVELGGEGRVRVPYPVTGVDGNSFELDVPYRVVPPGGSAVEGRLQLQLPVVTMQIDRPGADVITDAAEVEIAGAVEAGASVRVNGEEIPVKDGRFLHRALLEEVGAHPFTVVARAEQKAPREATLKVTRVADLAKAAAAFEVEKGLDYARIAQNPAIYRGQPVAFEGRVYNVDVQRGGSILQMLVRDCPRGHKCQLWVDYAQATDATVGSMVRVLGTISGQQQYRSRSGGVQTAPSVAARFILPLRR